jgi:xanthine dehydrogenase YagR molybdenum-binding subunit
MRPDGTLEGIRHDVVYANTILEDFPEYQAAGTRSLYACENIATTHRAVRLNLIQPTAMRAPNEGMGNFALESALDELAWQTGLDPVELRLHNYAQNDPLTGRPFSSKKLREAYALGAEKFGWSFEPRRIGELSEGDDLIGHGMATCLMTVYRMPSVARLRMRPDATIAIEAGSQEIGTGVRTIMPQIAAEVLGVDPATVTMVLGDTDLPVAGPTYGSSSTMGLGSAVARAAQTLKERLDSARHEDEPYAATIARAGTEIVVEGAWEPAETNYAMFTFGAVFVEARVDRALGLVRVPRCVGAYSVGRVINAKTATSQMTGGMIWGLGQALLERSETDSNLGRFVSKNLAGFLLPVNADVGALEAHFIDEYDEHASAIGVKGIGELGATGVAAAVVNAVYHATGKRVRRLPIRPEDLLDV